jgi:anti-sigma28 factor (negative regulator of flagellin synthesis)
VKIDQRDALNIVKPQSGTVQEPLKTSGKSTSAANRGASSGDQIDLGGQNWLLSGVQTAGASQRESRVAELRALVQSGQYQVDPAALSQSIVGSALSGD